MAFVTIDNPGGILHHGGQMAWDAVSDTRIVMVTITADYKAVIQEINQVDGAPVVGTPYFVGQLPNAQPWFHMRPKIKSMGNNLVFVMVPNSWSYAGQYEVGYGSIYSTTAPTNTSAIRNNARAPVGYTGYVMERNSSGQYSVKSSATFSTSDQTNSPGVFDSPLYALNISSASTTSITIRKAVFRNSGNSVPSNRLPLNAIKIPVADGILGAPTSSIENHAYIGNFTNYLIAADLKNIKDLNGVETEIVTVSDLGTALTPSSQYRCIWTLPLVNTLYHDCYLICANPTYTSLSKATLTNFTPNGVALPDANKRGNHYAIGGSSPSAGVSYNSNYLSQPTYLSNPLDTGWVSSEGVVCIVGGKQDTSHPLMTFDSDLAMHLHATNIGGLVDTVRPLQLSFRLPVGAGQYIGPYDPIATPYFYKERTNNSKVLHKVDDKHFWLIGCFMTAADATPQLGVISVSV